MDKASQDAFDAYVITFDEEDLPHPLLDGGVPGREISPALTDGGAFAGDFTEPRVTAFPDNISKTDFHVHPIAREGATLSSLSWGQKAEKGLVVPAETQACKSFWAYSTDEEEEEQEEGDDKDKGKRNAARKLGARVVQKIRSFSNLREGSSKSPASLLSSSTSDVPLPPRVPSRFISQTPGRVSSSGSGLNMLKIRRSKSRMIPRPLSTSIKLVSGSMATSVLAMRDNDDPDLFTRPRDAPSPKQAASRTSGSTSGTGSNGNGLKMSRELSRTRTNSYSIGSPKEPLSRDFSRTQSCANSSSMRSRCSSSRTPHSVRFADLIGEEDNALPARVMSGEVIVEDDDDEEYDNSGCAGDIGNSAHSVISNGHARDTEAVNPGKGKGKEKEVETKREKEKDQNNDKGKEKAKAKDKGKGKAKAEETCEQHVPIRGENLSRQEPPTVQLRQARQAPMEYARQYYMEEAAAEKQGRPAQLPRPSMDAYWSEHHKAYLVVPRIPKVVNRFHLPASATATSANLATIDSLSLAQDPSHSTIDGGYDGDAATTTFPANLRVLVVSPEDRQVKQWKRLTLGMEDLPSVSLMTAVSEAWEHNTVGADAADPVIDVAETVIDAAETVVDAAETAVDTIVDATADADAADIVLNTIIATNVGTVSLREDRPKFFHETVDLATITDEELRGRGMRVRYPGDSGMFSLITQAGGPDSAEGSPARNSTISAASEKSAASDKSVASAASASAVSAVSAASVVTAIPLGRPEPPPQRPLPPMPPPRSTLRKRRSLLPIRVAGSNSNANAPSGGSGSGSGSAASKSAASKSAASKPAQPGPSTPSRRLFARPSTPALRNKMSAASIVQYGRDDQAGNRSGSGLSPSRIPYPKTPTSPRKSVVTATSITGSAGLRSLLKDCPMSKTPPPPPPPPPLPTAKDILAVKRDFSMSRKAQAPKAPPRLESRRFAPVTEVETTAPISHEVQNPQQASLAVATAFNPDLQQPPVSATTESWTTPTSTSTSTSRLTISSGHSTIRPHDSISIRHPPLLPPERPMTAMGERPRRVTEWNPWANEEGASPSPTPHYWHVGSYHEAKTQRELRNAEFREREREKVRAKMEARIEPLPCPRPQKSQPQLKEEGKGKDDFEKFRERAAKAKSTPSKLRKQRSEESMGIRSFLASGGDAGHSTGNTLVKMASRLFRRSDAHQAKETRAAQTPTPSVKSKTSSSALTWNPMMHNSSRIQNSGPDRMLTRMPSLPSQDVRATASKDDRPQREHGNTPPLPDPPLLARRHDYVFGEGRATMGATTLTPTPRLRQKKSMGNLRGRSNDLGGFF